MSTLPSVTVANGVVVTADPDDPLVARRSEISREHLREAIRRLSADERDALRLVTRERRSIDEAAEELEIAPGDVHSRLFSSLDSLRHALLDQIGED